MIARDFKLIQKNTLCGFVELVLDSGLVIKNCSWHVREDREWIGLPGKPQIGSDGQQRRDDRGKLLFTNIFDFRDNRVRERFQSEALAAVHALVDQWQQPGQVRARHDEPLLQ